MQASKSKLRKTACAQEEKRKPYLWSEYLAAIPFTMEENVAVAIHGVSGGNRAVHGQWPIQPESFPLYLLDADREDLQGSGGSSWGPNWVMAPPTFCHFSI
jgi:hypothetical protein